MFIMLLTLFELGIQILKYIDFKTGKLISIHKQYIYALSTVVE